ncbi:MAG: DNA polymerase ligase N-terminal domain-containing protein [Candidatus Woykebacteria bacterium]
MLNDSLSTYREKRDPNITPEPFTSENIDPKKLVYVVQKHQATALHYDFRLEAGGAMPSWAVPKGPTLDPSVKRLAMQTENHPLDYRHFEGVIPEGQYGAGTVIIWDFGTYWPEIEEDGERVQVKTKKEAEKVLKTGLEKGELKFFLNGKKLKGSFALVKTKGFAGKNAWLLIKHKDKYAQEGFDAKDLDFSAKTNKSLADISNSPKQT